ncbi:DUF1499 domain-containing protein [Vibrio sp. CK2-1]|uniref:DUF1499 domain-containing protein n=1 Tax=Vibrio sp. CK2-1 TaxID=2912249 RepID=UPI001F388A99|nr:DUF1499 domain-containing protein [Vibrio sp. CK2-1]MCF7355189.1 DUF1499 domain-containing protein [Vibrio sp. CK2-1]
MRKLSTLAMVILLTGCTQSYAMKDNNPDLLCSSKPNCVSTQELRSDYQVAPFELISEATTIDEIEQVALTLKRTKTVNKTDERLHLESTSLIFRFVDDLHIVKQGSLLQVRSKSRVGYSDFGVNKSRVEALREKLIAANLLKPSP